MAEVFGGNSTGNAWPTPFDTDLAARRGLAFELVEGAARLGRVDWLRRNRPEHYPPGIMHGDYQFANVMYAHGAPAKLVAIID